MTILGEFGVGNDGPKQRVCYLVFYLKTKRRKLSKINKPDLRQYRDQARQGNNKTFTAV